MSVDPNYALQVFIARLENHLEVISTSRGATDATVDAAFGVLADAFEAYDDALYDKYGELLPFTIPNDES